MFKTAVYLVHGLLFILVALVGLSPVLSIAAPDQGRDQIYNWVWGSMIVIFMLLVLGSAFVQLRIKKGRVFLLSVIGLIAFFILTYQYIYPFVLNLFLE
ncbi:hypothetical protein [Jeotgalibacillus campisalis]|uniref:hypothetical protein n=1 Tax=Jeotgalibacillus campisalis TaxID=220754 RepID=UPI000596B446|nr:hypothetical protein [Jeotgalibacillus campisalis]